MSGLKFVDPNARERERLPLEGGEEWVEIKKVLTNREQRRINTAGFRGLKGKIRGDEDVELGIDWDAMEFERVATYVIGWSSDVQFNRANLERLESEDFDAIKDAIDKHLEAREAAKKKKKLGPTETTTTGPDETAQTS